MKEISGFIKQSTVVASAGAIGRGAKGLASAAGNPKGLMAGLIENSPAISTGAFAAGVTAATLLTPGAMLDSWFGRSNMMNCSIFFQFFPESISDSRSVNIGEVSMPLMPNPLPGLVSSSPRNISFEAVFAQEKWAGEGNDNFKWDKHNFNVGIALQVLRSFCYPMGAYTPLPQPLMLNLPGTRIGIDQAETRGDTVFCLLKDYNATRKAFFPDGSIRVASVHLSFQEFSVLGGGPGLGITAVEDFASAYSTYVGNTMDVIDDISLVSSDFRAGVGKTKNTNSAHPDELLFPAVTGR
jgi:hypothetical protein